MQLNFSTALVCAMVLAAPPAFSLPTATPTARHALPQNDLKQFEGIFQKVDNKEAHIQFTVKEGALEGKQLWDNRAYELVRQAGDDFVSKPEDHKVRFVMDGAGAVTKVMVGHSEWVKVKMYVPRKVVQLPAAELKRMEGKYRFQQDQNMLLQITAKDGHLVLKQLWDDKEIMLWAESEVNFFSKQQLFPASFSKDAAGNITGLRCFEADQWDKIE